MSGGRRSPALVVGAITAITVLLVAVVLLLAPGPSSPPANLPGEAPAGPVGQPSASAANAPAVSLDPRPAPAVDAPGPTAPDLPPDHPPIAPVDEKAQVTIQWLGHACFYVHTPGGMTVVTDPFDAGAAGLPAPAIGSHFVTVSSPGPLHDFARVIHPFPAEDGRYTALHVLRGDGTARGDLNITAAEFGQAPGGRGPNHAYVIEAGALRIAHLGNPAAAPGLEAVRRLGRVDILLVPAGGEAMGQRDAAEVARIIAPRIVIPMAYRTPSAGPAGPPLKPLDSFISATPFAVTARDSDVLLVSPSELPPSTEIQTLRLRL